MEELRKEFEKETGKKAIVKNQYEYPTEQYFKWLETKLTKEREKLSKFLKFIRDFGDISTYNDDEIMLNFEHPTTEKSCTNCKHNYESLGDYPKVCDMCQCANGEYLNWKLKD